MRIHVPLLALLTLFATGCPRSIDPALSGPVSFSYDVQHGEAITRYSGTIPAEESADLLRQLVPREDQYKNSFTQHTTRATLEYNGVKTSVEWTLLKFGKRVYIFKVRGGKYVLEEPHSMDFEKLLKTYGTGVTVDRE